MLLLRVVVVLWRRRLVLLWWVVRKRRVGRHGGIRPLPSSPSWVRRQGMMGVCLVAAVRMRAGVPVCSRGVLVLVRLLVGVGVFAAGLLVVVVVEGVGVRGLLLLLPGRRLHGRRRCVAGSVLRPHPTFAAAAASSSSRSGRRPRCRCLHTRQRCTWWWWPCGSWRCCPCPTKLVDGERSISCA